MLNLDEAIKHCEEVAEKQEITARSNLIEIDKIKADGILRLYDADEYESCMKCAEEHRQLAEWLRELKEYKDLSTYNRPNKCSECEYEDSEYYCDDCIWNFVDKFKQREVNADDKK